MVHPMVITRVIAAVPPGPAEKLAEVTENLRQSIVQSISDADKVMDAFTMIISDSNSVFANVTVDSGAADDVEELTNAIEVYESQSTSESASNSQSTLIREIRNDITFDISSAGSGSGAAEALDKVISSLIQLIEGFSENLENTVLVDFSYDADTKTFSYVLETTTEVYGEHVESESEKASGSGSGTEHVVVDFVETFLQVSAAVSRQGGLGWF